MDINLPIHVRTDASDYGIGGYILQLEGHKVLSIRFISKSLHKSQLNWSTIEKEAFAIFYTVTKYDFLLRDVKFTLETDHKNLTYLKTAQSAKVKRWQLALQEYDFSCIHIAGEANVVADAFSRLCERHLEDDNDSANLPTYLLALFRPAGFQRINALSTYLLQQSLSSRRYFGRRWRQFITQSRGILA